MPKTVGNNEVAEALSEKEQRQYREHLEHLEQKRRAGVIFEKVEPRWGGAAVSSITEPLYDFDTLDVPKLWSHYNARGQGINVYVIDSGVATHPSLLGSKLTAMSFITGNTSPVDGAGHGTWVCGKIGAAGVGLAPKCSLFSLRTLDDSGSGMSKDSTAALKWVLSQPDAHLVNMSLGSTSRSTEQEAVLGQLAAAGVLVVAAAGNSNTNVPFYPAAYPSPLAIAAYDRNEVKASFSNYGTHIDMSAPGVSCYSTYLGGTFRKMSGTSMATPITTGLLAMAMSYIKGKNPGISRVELRNLVLDKIQATAKDLGEAGRDQYYGFGGLNALKFFESLG